MEIVTWILQINDFVFWCLEENMFETWLTADLKDSPLSYYNFFCFDPHYINPVPVSLPLSNIISFESLISKYQTNCNINLKWVDDYGGPTIFSEWSGKAKSTPYNKKIELLKKLSLNFDYVSLERNIM